MMLKTNPRSDPLCLPSWSRFTNFAPPNQHFATNKPTSHYNQPPFYCTSRCVWASKHDETTAVTMSAMKSMTSATDASSSTHMARRLHIHESSTLALFCPVDNGNLVLSSIMHAWNGLGLLGVQSVWTLWSGKFTGELRGWWGGKV